MATTRIIPMHLNKGKTIRQCLSDRLDYGKNPEKTENGTFITSYACSPDTADAEFAMIFSITHRCANSIKAGYCSI